MTTEQKIVSLTHNNLTIASVSLEEGIPSGWMETVAIVRSPDVNIQKRKRKKGAERQKRLGTRGVACDCSSTGLD